MSARSGTILRTARRRARLTQRELSRRCGVPQPTISRIEADRMSPTFELLDRVMEACGVELVVVDRVKADDVDRSLIRGNLRLTPAQRLRNAVAAWNNTAPFRRPAS